MSPFKSKEGENWKLMGQTSRKIKVDGEVVATVEPQVGDPEKVEVFLVASDGFLRVRGGGGTIFRNYAGKTLIDGKSVVFERPGSRVKNDKRTLILQYRKPRS